MDSAYIEKIKQRIALGVYNPNANDVAACLLKKVTDYQKRIRRLEEKTKAQDRHQLAIHHALKVAV